MLPSLKRVYFPHNGAVTASASRGWLPKQPAKPNKAQWCSLLVWTCLQTIFSCNLHNLALFVLSADFKHTAESVSSWSYPHRQPVYAAHNTGGHGYSSAPSRGRRVDPGVREHTPASHAEILTFERASYTMLSSCEVMKNLVFSH